MLTLYAISRAVEAISSRAMAQAWAEPLWDAMLPASITTVSRASIFLGEVGHESGRFRYVKELWGPTPAQKRYERDFTAAWPPTAADDRNRKAFDLGNEHPGDGLKFRGHGLIQVTGRGNHRECGAALGLPLEEHPELLELPENAAKSAAWFWTAHGLNDLADGDQITRITKIINGGLNGLDERKDLWKRAKEALK